MRGVRRAAGSALAIVLGALAFASMASADVPVLNFGIKPNSTAAGSHPDLQIAFYLKDQKTQQHEGETVAKCGCANPRIIRIHAPPGLVGNPHATPRCTAVEFASNACPTDSQIGLVQGMLAWTPEASMGFAAPLYNLVPREGEPGLVGFQVLGDTTFETISTRTGSDYGLDTTVYLWNGIAPRLINQIYFGVPASPSNDRLRFKFPGIVALLTSVCDGDGNPVSPNLPFGQPADPYGPLSGPDSFQKSCGFGGEGTFNGQTPTSSTSPEIPFIEAPTTCGVPLESSIDVLAYDGGETHSESPYPSTTGCDQLQFNPSLAASPTTKEADTPSGLEVDMTVPQTQSPRTPSPSEIRSVSMTLPAGFSVNANAADGKTACQDGEARFGTEDEARCPEFAKIGTLEIRTALLPGPLPGYVYLGRPLPGERYRVFLTADGFSIHIKLAGTLHIDPSTGQVSVTFENLPQTPFEEFRMHIFGAERGSLATPAQCGTYPVHSTFVPWDSALPDQTSTQFFTIDSGPGGTPCPGKPRPFAPGFSASSVGNTAGAYTPFSVELTRSDGDQLLSGVNVKTPPGFTAAVRGIPYCPESAIAELESPLHTGIDELTSSACPSPSQIGTAVAAAGAGSKPLYVRGKVFLAGPYRGAPLSLVAVFPAVSGPYDLGNVATRVALNVDPVTAQVSAVSDPLPQIVGGIPLRTREIRVDLDHPDFTLNPTDCRPFSVRATALGDEGATADLSSPFQVANCAALPFEPRLRLKLRGAIGRNAHPALQAVLSMKEGEAHLAGTSALLPRSTLVDQSHIRTTCTNPQFAAHECPEASIYGYASGESPLLEKPLSGPVYLRASHHSLPDLVADLRGQFNITLAARIDSVHGGLRATFSSLPDVPVSKFVLQMQGGKKGLLIDSENLCERTQRAAVRMTGQNGRSTTRHIELQRSCGTKGPHKVLHRVPHARDARSVRRAREVR